MVWVNAKEAGVAKQIRELRKRQNGGESWDQVDDGNRLAALELTAERLRYQNAPLAEDVAAARARVSRQPMLSAKDSKIIVATS